MCYQALRQSREESQHFKEKWDQAQEDAERRREEGLNVQKELCSKVDQMMEMFQLFSKPDFSRPSIVSVLSFSHRLFIASPYTSKLPPIPSFPPGFVPQSQAQTVSSKTAQRTYLTF